MAVSPQTSGAMSGRPHWLRQFLVDEMWPSLAIVVIWLAVLFDALWGPDFVSSSGAGTNTTRIPSAIILAVFAYLATREIARHGFRRSA